MGKRGNGAIFANEFEDGVGDATAVERANCAIVDVAKIFVIENVEVLFEKWKRGSSTLGRRDG